jgi:hypothetical protein
MIHMDNCVNAFNQNWLQASYSQDKNTSLACINAPHIITCPTENETSNYESSTTLINRET